jgi:hypothetical protein
MNGRCCMGLNFGQGQALNTQDSTALICRDVVIAIKFSMNNAFRWATAGGQTLSRPYDRALAPEPCSPNRHPQPLPLWK